MVATSPLTSPLAPPAWLVQAPAPTLESAGTTWYESLFIEHSKAEDIAFKALRWLLSELPGTFLVAQAQDRFDDEVILVPASDPLALAVADTATALFQLTGAFTQDQAEAFAGAARAVLMHPVSVPVDVIAPPMELTSRWGAVSRGGRAWFWEQMANHEAVLAGAPPRQGMLRASTEMEAIDRLRERFPDVGPFHWINRRSYQFPWGVQAAG